ncbi:MAG TPA: aminotransferase class III-fold pyridoxal phosphate-dependent enzyme [Micromonosporaceae bacterium]|jgi:adenosylmethionine-8-amino-7-oxononanoate aminotransferase|nr:aminotransferase class III-fold pyridoxal phosphate-dependent enzyme [Micromonosporaceae bacterium]
MGPDEREAVRRDGRHVWHPWSAATPNGSRVLLARGDGYHVWDLDGRRYLDGISSALNATCGHRHPALRDAVTRQMDLLCHMDLSVGGHEPSGLLAERIAGLMPDGLDRTLFVNSGSEAAEAAVRIAVDYWAQLGHPRRRIITFARGYHGATLLCQSLSGLPHTAHPMRNPAPVNRVVLPYPPRELRGPAGLAALLAEFDRALRAGSGPQDVAAVLVEPLLNVGGGVVLPAGFLRGLAERCSRSGALLVLDEVFTGFGRTGAMFGFDHDGVRPDLVMTSKGLSAGYLPLGAVTVTGPVYDAFRTGPSRGRLHYGHTTSGHAVACAAGLAAISVLEQQGLVARAAALGSRLLALLEPLTGGPHVVDVRGLGLVGVVEMDTPEAADRVNAGCLARGLLVRQQLTSIMVVPPLIIDEAGVDEIAEALTGAVVAAAETAVPT